MAGERLDSTQEALARLRDDFAGRLDGTVATLTGLAERIEVTETQVAALAELQRELHRIRGTAGTFGFTGAARLAAEMERAVETWRLESGGNMATAKEQAARVRQFIALFANQVRAG